MLQTIHPKNPYFLHLQTKQQEAEHTELEIEGRCISNTAKSSAAIVNPTGCPTVFGALPKYMAAKNGTV